MENKEVLVSIIIPVYNMEKLLSKCIESIINQTHKRIEIIVVDDGSTDRSGSISDEYAKKDNRVRVVHQKNGGIACALNSGMDEMKGNYFLFVDSDDYIDSNMVKRLLDIMLCYDADIVQCGTYAFKNIEGIPFIPQSEGELFVYNSRGEILDDFFHYRRISRNLAARLFKSSLVTDIRCEPGRMIIDSVTLPRILVRCNKYVFVNEKYYYIYARTTSVSRRPFTVSQWEDYKYGNTFTEDFIKTHCPEYIDFSWYRHVYTNKKAYLEIYKNSGANKRLEIMNESFSLFKKHYPSFVKTKWYSNIKNGEKISFFMFLHFPVLYRVYWLAKTNCLNTASRLKYAIIKHYE